MTVGDLRTRAVQHRTLAVEALEAGHPERAERHELTADQLSAEASVMGDKGYQLPRVRSDQTAQDRKCEVCRRKYQSTRGDARFCSARCRQTAVRRRARARRDPTVTDRGVKAQVSGPQNWGSNV